MNCRKVRRYLFGYFRRELSPDQTEKIKTHLDSCPECAKEAKDIENINLLLRDDLETLAPSADFNEKLLAKIQAISPEKEKREERSWWQELLHEVFPSLRLRWAVAGAASVIIITGAVMLSQRQTTAPPEYLSQDEGLKESETVISSQGMGDSLFGEVGRRAGKTYTNWERAFVIDNFSFSARGGEDGMIRPEDLYKSFIIEKKSHTTAGRTGNRYVLPVVSTQPVSQKTDY
jgi:hypothetical protein